MKPRIPRLIYCPLPETPAKYISSTAASPMALLIKFEKESYARIGVMPRYGDADSVKWFEVEPYCTFHIVNCFETGDEVVVMGCRAPEAIIPGPDLGIDKFQWFSKGFKPMTKKAKCADNTFEEGYFFSHLYEWRLNMKTGGVTGRYLTGMDFSVDFPMINDHFIGLYNKYAYAQVVDSPASSICALPKYGSLAKFYLEEQVNGITELEKHSEDLVKVEHRQLGINQFCSGTVFVSKQGDCDEDDGWIVSFVHNEDTNASQVSSTT
ncbi:putative Carotenoid 9,10(9',10')-cleavage dioxygenase [Cocos nucifera]|uniref:Putative Carotenoid 9,10(9',10')-cleavage dioxygenase n=1 Tax=Cocos nucifera TaxID=13894 RepID=A0A8K0N2S6_COCNU|nr:putative Carotenoid 9,10(9',10')-cleavage dioxygenase [Cocos nucifera]